MKDIKILHLDIETSYNQGSFWRAGFKLNINYQDIKKERGIICICYKWHGQKKVHSLEWSTNQSDKKLVKEFIKVMDEADVIVGHNINRFDLKHIRTRALFHGLPMKRKYNVIDTLTLARSLGMFNSNKLDYLAQYLGVGCKIKTSMALWDNIILHKCPKAMRAMVKYCKQDVVVLEAVFTKFLPYIPENKFKKKVKI